MASQNESKRTNWHRLLELVSEPLFSYLGFETKIEVDLLRQSQYVDIIVVQRLEGKPHFSELPRIYWEDLKNLIKYNLISFKSASESFNTKALEGFFGHFTNYRKINNLKREKINLYAIVYHYPRKHFSTL